MQSYLEDYNEMSNNPMNLVLFQFAIQHIARICRVIKQPQGNVLLVGVGGSGRQSLAKLGAFIQGFDIYQVCMCTYLSQRSTFQTKTKNNIAFHHHLVCF